MWKIKYSLLKNWIEKDLTSSEIRVLLYVARRQNESGLAQGIYYKDVYTETQIAPQSYYNALDGLVEKQIIKYTKWNRADRDIQILNNDFSDKKYEEGYIDLGHTIFSDPQFYEMKAPEIQMCLDFIKNCTSGKRAFIIGKEKLFNKYRKCFSCGERTIRGYLHTIRKFFNIRFKNGMYSIIAKAKKVYRKKLDTIGSGETEAYRLHIARVACNRAKVREYGEKEIKDVYNLLHQYRKYGTEKTVADTLIDAVATSIKLINKKHKKKSEWQYKLYPKYIHKLLLESGKLIKL